MPPEARIDRVGRLAVDELEGVEVDQHATVSAKDLAFGARHESALGVLKVLRIVELQLGRELGIDFQCFGCDISSHTAHAAGFAAAACQHQKRCHQRKAQCLHQMFSSLSC